MENENLNIELAKRIFGNLGAIPGDKFGKFGITTDEYIHDKIIKFKEDGKIRPYQIYCAQINVQSQYKIILTNIGTIEHPEFIAVLNNVDVTFGFSLANSANFVMLNEDKWLGISLLHRLNLTVAIEMITQQGIRWEPCPDQEDTMYNFLMSLLAEEDA